MMAVQPALPKPIDSDQYKGAVEGDRPTDEQNSNENAPAGLDGNGLPLGLQLIGRPFDEEALFALGHVMEQAAGRFSPERWW